MSLLDRRPQRRARRIEQRRHEFQHAARNVAAFGERGQLEGGFHQAGGLLSARLLAAVLARIIQRDRNLVRHRLQGRGAGLVKSSGLNRLHVERPQHFVTHEQGQSDLRSGLRQQRICKAHGLFAYIQRDARPAAPNSGGNHGVAIQLQLVSRLFQRLGHMAGAAGFTQHRPFAAGIEGERCRIVEAKPIGDQVHGLIQ